MAKAFLFLTTATGILIFSSVASGGSIQFDEVLSFSVPGLDTIKKFEFGDVDFDGYNDILAGDSRNVVVYSYQKDSILFSYNLDSLIPPDIPRYYDIVLSDVNRDAYPDVIIGACMWYLSEMKLLFYSGKGFWGLADSFVTAFTGGDPCPFGPPIQLFDAIDFDRDGHTEFVFSLQYCDSQPLYITEWTRGFLNIYYSFPDSIVLHTELVFTGPAIEFPQPYLNYTALPTYAWGHSWWPTRPSSTTEGGGFRIFKGFEEFGAPFPSFADFDPPPCNDEYESKFYGPLCVGDIDDTSWGTEILLHVDHWYCCYETIVPTCTSETFLELYRFEEPNRLYRLWRIPGTVPGSKFFLPNSPGSFFTITTDSVYQYDGRDGSLIQSSPHSMVGIRRWDHPFYDRHEFFVTTNANNVVIYQPAIMTDAGDVKQPPLPATLSLGKPYPNPFNAEQTIPVTIKVGRHLTIDVYDILGRKIDQLFDGIAEKGEIRLIWNAGACASGVYFVRATTEEHSTVVRSVLIK